MLETEAASEGREISGTRQDGTDRPIRLAIIAPFPVLPASAGGKIRIVQLARALSALGVDVTIIAPYHFTQTRELADAEPFVLRAVPYPPALVPFLFVDRPFPYGWLISFHRGYQALLPVPLESFDVCQFEHPAFVDLARSLPTSMPVVYGSQNVEFDYVSAECPNRRIRKLAGGRIHKLETELVKRASHVFACTEADRRRFGALYQVAEDHVSIVPNGVDMVDVESRLANRNATTPMRSPTFTRRAIFAGSDVKHNRQAASEILTSIAPQFEREIEFVFLGPVARRIRERGPNIVVAPTADLAQYVCPTAIGLNPVTVGSGSSLKLLYYLAHGLPTLTTPFGLRGYEDLSSRVVTADLDQFPDALRREQPIPEGVRAALQHYEWKSIATDALRVYESLLGRSPSVSR